MIWKQKNLSKIYKKKIPTNREEEIKQHEKGNDVHDKADNQIDIDEHHVEDVVAKD